ncbi:diphosphomevalonate decarboxylase [Weissella cibaria]|uniref:diphosphomevalonate decarboxylase n=1 Tax=Weissella cibaria TaxID=137591 RepID=UPI0002191CAF|nr:diphosphomevalonate decarboxylase [Weissella cibaria]APS27550.1 Homoserine kinase [Weissella cibaria]APU62948.1 shikimate kinase [Weissella cibaria]APU65099.1 shikimate kinase [Weissella cibaria]ASS51524.1 Homoserine kinase [Weissella cibaria]UJF03199.1 diphosphomevalonate decarboxylase [Weissella cibaria]
MTHYTARAHTNIALLKYWGKADTTLMLPTTTSISLTLDEFYTDTTVWFDAALIADDVTLDDEVMTGKGYDKVTRFLDLVREMAGETRYAHVHSANHVPTAAGLASSASAFAALAGAASRAAGLALSPAELSRLARRGSGSASRSIFGGFAQWDRGHDDLTSVAKPLVETIDWPIQLLTVIINDQPKKIDSRGGMQHAKATSPFYDDWVNRSNALVPVMQTAVANHDIDQIGQLAEANALQMHATNATAQPAFNYLTDSSWQVINLATTLREQGISVYATMDAGPNVKLISRPADTEVITAALAEAIPGVVVRTATPGPSIKIVEGDQI